VISCPDCKGSGHVRDSWNGEPPAYYRCPACRGTGTLPPSQGPQPEPEPGPIVPSPLFDGATLEHLDRMEEEFRRRKEVPR